MSARRTQNARPAQSKVGIVCARFEVMILIPTARPARRARRGRAEGAKIVMAYPSFGIYICKMLEERDINVIAQKVVSANLHSNSVHSVLSAPATDSQGDPALKITITLTPGSTDTIQGKDILKTLDQLQQSLQEAGEERFPIVEFETKGELPIGD